MKRTRKKASSEASSRVAIRMPAPEPPDLETVRSEVIRIVSANALDMVETTIQQVKNGHSQAFKYLFELIGLWPAASTEPEAAAEDTLAGVLLRRLGLPEDSGALSPADSRTPEAARRRADTVK